MNEHIYLKTEFPGTINGEKVLDEYFICDRCKLIMKAIRENGCIHYIVIDGSLAGRFLKEEPPCLIVVEDE